jgi:hypothetical protein
MWSANIFTLLSRNFHLAYPEPVKITHTYRPMCLFCALKFLTIQKIYKKVICINVPSICLNLAYLRNPNYRPTRKEIPIAKLQNVQHFSLSCQKDGSDFKSETNPLLRTDLIKEAGRCSFGRNELLILQMFRIHVCNERMAHSAAHVLCSKLHGVTTSKKKVNLHSYLRENIEVSLRRISITKSGGILLFLFGPVTTEQKCIPVRLKWACMQLAWPRPSL